MASIIRNGIEIKLTDDEILAIRKEEYRNDVLYDIDEELTAQEENDWISFDSWESSGSDYASAEDARADFIEYVCDSIIERQEDFDEPPYSYRSGIASTISDYADDMGYWKGK